MTARSEALGQIKALIDRHGLTPDDIMPLFRTSDSTKRQGNMLKTLLGYTGGIFVFSGICLLFGMIWDDIGAAQRVVATLGSGLTAFILGLVALKDPRFDKAVTPLFLAAAFLQPAGLFVFLDEYFPDSNNIALAATSVFGVMLVQQLTAFRATQRSSLLFLTLFFWSAFLTCLMGWLDLPDKAIGLIVGISLTCLTYAIDKTEHRSIVPFWYFWGIGALLAASFAWLEDTPFDILYLGISALAIYLSIQIASRTALFVSVIALMGYLSYFTYEYFADVTGWPIALIVMGLIMIGLSGYALKLGSTIKDRR